MPQTWRAPHAAARSNILAPGPTNCQSLFKGGASVPSAVRLPAKSHKIPEYPKSFATHMASRRRTATRILPEAGRCRCTYASHHACICHTCGALMRRNPWIDGCLSDHPEVSVVSRMLAWPFKGSRRHDSSLRSYWISPRLRRSPRSNPASLIQ